MTRMAPALLAVVAGLAMAVALASCGNEDAKLLPGTTAQEIDENLDSVQRLAEEGECIEAEDAALQVSTQIEALSGIDPALKRALRDGATRLNEVVSTCDEVPEDTVEEETTPDTTESTEEEGEGKEKGGKKPQAEKESGSEGQQKGGESKPAEEAEAQPQPSEPEAAPEEESGGEQSGGIGPGAPAGSN